MWWLTCNEVFNEVVSVEALEFNTWFIIKFDELLKKGHLNYYISVQRLISSQFKSVKG